MIVLIHVFRVALLTCSRRKFAGIDPKKTIDTPLSEDALSLAATELDDILSDSDNAE